jgi:hypothetical protein
MALSVGVDTFVDLATADAYMAARLRADAWEGAETDDKEKALRMATAILSRQRYLGVISSDSQLLAWPRNGAIDTEGRAIGMTAIPQAVKDASCEFALRLLADDFYADSANRRIKKLTIATISVEYDGQAPEREMPDVVLELIRPLLRSDPMNWSARLIF